LKGKNMEKNNLDINQARNDMRNIIEVLCNSRAERSDLDENGEHNYAQV
jgi:hypothetical protein